MHVDFGILFGEGACLGYPETVPYRLTHNLVGGMGVLGYEVVSERRVRVFYGAFVMDTRVCTHPSEHAFRV